MPIFFVFLVAFRKSRSSFADWRIFPVSPPMQEPFFGSMVPSFTPSIVSSSRDRRSAVFLTLTNHPHKFLFQVVGIGKRAVTQVPFDCVAPTAKPFVEVGITPLKVLAAPFAATTAAPLPLVVDEPLTVAAASDARNGQIRPLARGSDPGIKTTGADAASRDHSFTQRMLQSVHFTIQSIHEANM